ncbi:MAG: ABC transporter substrate-binding protein, partial [Dehalococcoidia bacterium]|nr:ABC transporter substrate-binding protein [Dehalococcoidia bacterium]
MLKKGEADAIDVSISSKKQVTDAGFKVKTISDAWNHSIVLYGSALPAAGPTYNKSVRQALSLAVNRDEVAKFIYDGDAVPGAQQTLTPVTLGFDPNLKPDPYDVEKAKQLLKDGGYEKGFNISLYTFPQAGNPELGRLAEVVAGYWDKIGVKATIIPIDLAGMRAMYNATPQPDKLVGQASTFALIQRGSSINQMRLLYHSKDVFRVDQNPEVDKLIDDSLKEADVKKVDENIRKAAQIEFDAARGFSVVRPNMLLALGKNVGDIQVIKGLPNWTKMMASATPAK